LSIVLRTYDTEKGSMVAAADASLVGEVFEENGVRVEVDEDFYGTEEAERDAVVERLAGATIANLVGEGAVGAGVEAEVVDEDNVLCVDGVPHAQMVRI